MRPLALFLVLTSTAVAHAGIHRVSLAVGQTIEHDVGYAIGVACDDPEIVAAEMHAKSAVTNLLVLTGKRPGTTLCRVGTDPFRVSYLFEITILPEPRSEGRADEATMWTRIDNARCVTSAPAEDHSLLCSARR